MYAPLSQDLRRRIARNVEKGCSIRKAAARYEVSLSAAVKLIPRVRRTGSLAPDRVGGHRRPVLEPRGYLLRRLVAAKAGITLSEIQAELKAAGSWWRFSPHPAHPGPSCPAVQKKTLRAAEQDRPDVARERQPWRVKQRYMDPSRFAFRDETGTTTTMTRRCGWAPKASEWSIPPPLGDCKITTFAAGLRASGLIGQMVLDGLMTGEVFHAYVEQVLVPELSPGTRWCSTT